MSHQALQKLISVPYRGRNPAVVENKQFNLHVERSPARQALEAYIADKYKQVHGASIVEFMPIMLDLSHYDVRLGALGLRPGQYKPMFLEQYLDKPIEQQVSAIANRPVDRHGLMEVGNLVVTHKGAGLLLFTVLAMALLEAGYEWMVFTATEEVERLMHRLGFDPQHLVHADPTRVQGGVDRWGGYYDLNPRVMVGSLKMAREVAERQDALIGVLDDYRPQISSIARSLADYRRIKKQAYS